MDARVLLGRNPAAGRLPARIDGSGASTGDEGRSEGIGTPEHIDDIGVRFIARFAGKADLTATGRHAPHLVNQLAAFIDDPAALLNAIDRIARQDKPGRDGLPFAVVKELAELREQCTLVQRRRGKRRAGVAVGTGAC
ncbi:MAG: hypothetical protein AB7P21_07045 [Lautropia sp.]